MRTRISAKLTVLAALALLGAAVGIDCSKASNPGDPGGLKIAFAIPDGTTISSVLYAITSNPGAAAGPSGSFNTSDNNANASFDLALQPTGPGVTDTVTLTATTSAGVACSGTSAAFTIVSNAPTLVNMQLICGAGTATSLPGTVDVRATVSSNDNCPNITQVIVAPAQASVGSLISVRAVASDSDGDSLTYTWGPAVNFTNPVGASDTYDCASAGAQTITLTVDDHHTGGNCTATITLPVTCVAGSSCGNGIVEPGETCDDTLPTCVNCQRIAGTGGAAGAATGGAAGAATGGAAGAGTGGAAGAAAGGTTGAAGAATGGTTGAAGAATGGTTGAAGAMVVSCGAPANGLWPDISGNGHDATLKNFSVGSGLVGDGTPGNAYAVNFDGVDDFAELAPGTDGLRLTSEATLEIWVNNNFAEGVGSYNNLYSNRNGAEYSGFFGSIINPGDINSSQWTAGATSDGASWVLPFPQAPGRPPSNTWTHFVATFSLSQGFYRLYINGALAASTALTAPIVYSVAAVPRVGGEVGSSYFRGKLGEVRIWAAALDANEVQARYQTGAPTYGIAAPSPTLTVTKPLALRLVATPCP